MKITALFLIIILKMCCTSAAYTVKETVQFPGSYNTFANVFDNGIVVGSYQASPNSPYHGFIYNGSTYTTLDVPGSDWTEVYGIDGNYIVGTYLGSDRFHGFLYDGASFQTIDPPDATNDVANGTAAIGIDGETIVGQYWKGRDQNGFVLENSSYATFNYPTGTLHSASDVDGSMIVGTFYAAPRYRGYLFNGQDFEIVDHPLGTDGTYANGISGNKVAGTYYVNVPGAHPVAHGFIYQSGAYTTWDVPPQLGNHTIISGISGKTIVGTYAVLGGPFRGFVAVIPEPSACCLMMTVLLFGVISSRRTSPSKSRSRDT